MSNVTFDYNSTGSSIDISFTVTGQSGTVGYGTLTIPKSLLQDGLTPIIYIDGKIVQNQGYSQDSTNFYVWYFTHFSTHAVSIVFTSNPVPTPNLPEFPILMVASLLLLVLVALSIVRYRQKNMHAQ